MFNVSPMVDVTIVIDIKNILSYLAIESYGGPLTVLHPISLSVTHWLCFLRHVT